MSATPRSRRSQEEDATVNGDKELSPPSASRRRILSDVSVETDKQLRRALSAADAEPPPTPHRKHNSSFMHCQPDMNFVMVTTLNLAALLTICFSYSFAAFKLDLKQHMSWRESQLSWVFTFATVGQNMVVHIGLFIDRYGAPWGYILAAVLKAVGLFGMWHCSVMVHSNVWLFGFFLFLDTQGMSCGIIMALKEVQRASPPRLSGLMASLCKGFFGFGAVYATSMYDYCWRPDVSMHFLSAGVTSTTVLVACAVAVPLLGGSRGKRITASSPKGVIVDESASLASIACSEAYLALFLGMFVAWGGGMLWNANMSSYATAAGINNGRQIRSVYYSAKTVCSLLVGPLSDFGTREVWWFMTVFAMFASGVIMMLTDGRAMFFSATLAGGAFGAVATLIPLMTKTLSFRYMGTLYAASKFAGMLSSVAWTFYAGHVAQKATKHGDSNCVGDECYRKSWYLVIGTSLPVVAFLFYWAMKAVHRDVNKVKAD